MSWGKHAGGEYEAEVIPGIEAIVMDELRALDGVRLSSLRRTRPGFVRFGMDGRPKQLPSLRSVIAAYQIHIFAIPRPKALLGHQHFTRLISILQNTIQRWTPDPLSLGLGAAGAETSVLRRLKQALAEALCLTLAEDGKGDLYIRLARQPDKKGWEILVRTTSQPLSKREWRVSNIPGALNATVACAMTQLNPLRHPAAVVNLCSGTSTILIEHALMHPGDFLLAVDNSERMIEAAVRNTEASQTRGRIHHIRADAGKTPLPSNSADRIYADLPFGHHIGSHAANECLYPTILNESARLARPHADLVLLTHEVRLLHRCLSRSVWKIKSETAINLRGLHPRLFVLELKSSRGYKV